MRTTDETDKLWARLADLSGGRIEDFLDGFFDFLRRRTDFYKLLSESPDGSYGFLPGAAEDMVLTAFHKQWRHQSLGGDSQAGSAETGSVQRGNVSSNAIATGSHATSSHAASSRASSSQGSLGGGPKSSNQRRAQVNERQAEGIQRSVHESSGQALPIESRQLVQAGHEVPAGPVTRSMETQSRSQENRPKEVGGEPAQSASAVADCAGGENGGELRGPTISRTNGGSSGWYHWNQTETELEIEIPLIRHSGQLTVQKPRIEVVSTTKSLAVKLQHFCVQGTVSDGAGTGGFDVCTEFVRQWAHPIAAGGCTWMLDGLSLILVVQKQPQTRKEFEDNLANGQNSQLWWDHPFSHQENDQIPKPTVDARKNVGDLPEKTQVRTRWSASELALEPEAHLF